MATFKCPSCRRFHTIQDNYDQSDYVCVDSRISELKEQQDIVPEDYFTRNAWNRNEFSTREDAFREVTIIDAEILPEKNRYTGKTRTAYNY